MVRIVRSGKGTAMGYARCLGRTFVVSAYVQRGHVPYVSQRSLLSGKALKCYVDRSI